MKYWSGYQDTNRSPTFIPTVCVCVGGGGLLLFLCDFVVVVAGCVFLFCFVFWVFFFWGDCTYFSALST